MGESTALEALTAELLGDVGKLHDEIKALPSLLEKTSAQLEEQTGAMLVSARHLTRQIDAHIQERAKAAAGSCTQDVHETISGLVNAAIKESLGNDLGKTISAIKAVTNEATNSIRTNENLIHELHNQRVISTGVWSILAGAVGSLLMAGVFLVFSK